MIEEMLQARRIAVVGVSEDPSRPSHSISNYLIDAGYDVVPVNPNLNSVLGRVCYPNLKSIPGQIDLVNIFRRPEFIPGLVADAIEIGTGGVWVQSGIRSPQAAAAALSAGLNYVEDRCIMVEHARRW